MTLLEVGLARGTISVCIPARNEAATVAGVVAAVRAVPSVGEVVVVDDGSSDGTDVVAARAGARVVGRAGPAGKGRAMAAALTATDSDLVVFLDADVRGVGRDWVGALVTPLLDDPGLVMSKATYRRPGEGGGRVTELVARPLLERFFPDLAVLRQPLAGEVAVRRSALEGIELEPGYGVEIGMVIDLARRYGARSIVEVDLGERVHRNRPLADLGVEAREVLHAVLRRVEIGEERAADLQR